VSDSEFAQKLRSIQFAGAVTKPTTKTVDGVEHRSSLNESTGAIGAIHSHHLKSERVDAHGFVDNPVAVYPESESL